MGKIFGIADLPVSTLHSTLQSPFYETMQPTQERVLIREYNVADKFVSTQKTAIKSNPFVRMRNGIGKLMKPFSKIKP